MVNADDDVEHIAYLDRRCHNHPFGTPVQVTLNGFWRQELACALQDNINPQFTPGDFRWRGVGAERKLFVTDPDDVLAVRANVFAPFTLHGVKHQKVCCSGDPALDFIQMHHFQAVTRPRIFRLPVRCAQGRPQGQPTNATHAIDSNLHRNLTH